MLKTDQSACSIAVSAVRHGLKVDRVAVLALGENYSTSQIVCSHPSVDPRRVPPGIIEAVSKTKRTVRRVFERTVESVAVVPIFEGRKIVGVMYLGRDDGVGFVEDEIRVVEAIAQQIVGTDVVPARSLRRDTIVDAFGLDDPTSVMWSDSEDEAGRADVLIAYGELLTPPAAVGLRAVFGQSVENIVSTAQSHVAAILSVRGLKSSPVAIAAKADAPAVASDQLLSQTVIDQVLWTGKPVLTIDARDGELGMVAESIQRLEVTMVMCAPIVHVSKTVGLLYTATFGVVASFNQKSLTELLAHARVLGPALKALRP